MIVIRNTPMFFVTADEQERQTIAYEERIDNPFVIDTSTAVYTPFKRPTRSCDRRTPSIPATRQKQADETKRPYLSASLDRRIDYNIAIDQDAVNEVPVYSRNNFTIEERATFWKNIDAAYSAMEKMK